MLTDVMPRVVALVDDVTPKYRWRIAAPYERMNREQPDSALMMWSEMPHLLPFPDGMDAVVLPGVSAIREGDGGFRMLIDAVHAMDAAAVFEMDDDVFTYAWVEHMVASMQAGTDDVRGLNDARAASVWSMRQCDAVTVSTERLAALVRAIRGDDRAHVVPNAIDVDWFRAGIGGGARGDGVTIGWSGGIRPERDLTAMLEGWRMVAARYPSVRFVFAGWAPYTIFRYLPPERVAVADWAEGNAYADAMAVDIGCCPAEPTPFNACKSPIKAMEYGAAGAAVVASRVPYETLIAQGENGYLADTREEWYGAIAALVEDGNRRADLATALQEDVRKHWSLDANWRAWPATYARIVGQHRASKLRLSVVR